MGDRFVATSADGALLEASPVRYGFIPRRSGQLPRGAMHEDDSVDQDPGWVTPAQYAASRSDRHALHANLLQQEMLGTTTPPRPSLAGSNAHAAHGYGAGANRAQNSNIDDLGDSDDGDGIGSLHPSLRSPPRDAMGLLRNRAPQFLASAAAPTTTAGAAAGIMDPVQAAIADGTAMEPIHPPARIVRHQSASQLVRGASTSTMSATAGQGTPPRRVLSFVRQRDGDAAAAAGGGGGSGSVDIERSPLRSGSRTHSAFSLMSGASSDYSAPSANSYSSGLQHSNSNMGSSNTIDRALDVRLAGNGRPPSESASALAAARRQVLHSASVSLSPLSAESQAILSADRKPKRRISRVPYKVLDAPGLADDFYFSLLDWSSQDVVAVALAEAIYMYNGSNGRINLLVKNEDGAPQVTSVAWSGRGGHLAVGSSAGHVTIYDAATSKAVRTLEGHKKRVTALSFGAFVLATGGKDRSILLRDLRGPEQYQARLVGHKAEICGLKFSPDWQLLASGGNDNTLNIWDHKMIGSQFTLSAEERERDARMWKFSHHKSAVKALCWSPHKTGLIASGGGNQDKQLRFFSTHTGELLDSVDTGSQVCTLTWSTSVDELVSTHGYVTHAVAVWQYPRMRRIATLYGHSQRVLYSALSPDGSSLVTGSGDSTLRFWSLFPSKDVVDGAGGSGAASAAAASVSAAAIPDNNGSFKRAPTTHPGTATMVSPLAEGVARHVVEMR